MPAGLIFFKHSSCVSLNNLRLSHLVTGHWCWKEETDEQTLSAISPWDSEQVIKLFSACHLHITIAFKIAAVLEMESLMICVLYITLHCIHNTYIFMCYNITVLFSQHVPTRQLIHKYKAIYKSKKLMERRSKCCCFAAMSVCFCRNKTIFES